MCLCWERTTELHGEGGCWGGAAGLSIVPPCPPRTAESRDLLRRLFGDTPKYLLRRYVFAHLSGEPRASAGSVPRRTSTARVVPETRVKRYIPDRTPERMSEDMPAKLPTDMQRMNVRRDARKTVKRYTGNNVGNNVKRYARECQKICQKHVRSNVRKNAQNNVSIHAINFVRLTCHGGDHSK